MRKLLAVTSLLLSASAASALTPEECSEWAAAIAVLEMANNNALTDLERLDLQGFAAQLDERQRPAAESFIASHAGLTDAMRSYRDATRGLRETMQACS